MCGIAGFFTNAPSPQPQARLMAQLAPLAHRGPDGQGLYTAGPEGMGLVREVFTGERPGPMAPPPMALTPPPAGVQVGLGVKRLAIVDLGDGLAPAFGQTGSVVVVLNGEIYNHAALRQELQAQGHRFATRCDTEVLAHLYERAGAEGMLSRIRGQFAIALWDARLGQLTLARDPMGIKPLYVARQAVAGGERIYFASEPRGILADAEFERRLEPGALARYLMMESVPAPRALFQGMEKLMPGHYMEIRAGSSGGVLLRRRAFWQLPHPVADRPPELPRPGDVEGWKHRVRAAIGDAVEMRIPDEVPVAALLSGGIDSGLVTAHLARKMTSPLHTYSVGFADKDFDQTHLAAQVAQHLGVEHTIIRLGEGDLEPLLDHLGHHMDEPLGDHSLVPTYAVCKAVREGGYPVAISGDGGDELFAGYPTYLARRLDPLLKALPAPMARLGLGALGRLPASGGNFSADVKARLLLEGALETAPHRRQLRWMGAMGESEMRGLLNAETLSWLDETEPAGPFVEVDAWARQHQGRSPLARALVQDMRFYMQDSVLVKVDRASMAASVESRVPLLDLGVAQLAMALPESMKIKGLNLKWMLRELMKEVLPPAIADAPKKGFGMPTSRWLRSLGPAKLMEWLSPPNRGPALLDEGALARLVDEHASGRRDHRRPLWTLIALRRWQSGPWSAGLG